MSVPDLSMLAGMMPPGVQQLIDLVPPIDTLDRVAAYLQSGKTQWDSSETLERECQGAAAFLAQLAQVLRAQGLVEEAREQTEPLRLECPKCHMTFGVDNAFQYRRRIDEGFMYACANEHEPTPVGSGRQGLLTDDEQLTWGNSPNLIVIFPKDESDVTSQNENSHTGG